MWNHTTSYREKEMTTATAPAKKAAVKKNASGGVKTKAASKKAPAKKKGAQSQSAKASKTGKEGTEAAPVATGPTQKQFRVLNAIEKGGKTRKQLEAELNVRKGWSALLGAPGKEIKPKTMQGLGWINQEGNPITVTITAAGKKVLAHARKAREAADKK